MEFIDRPSPNHDSRDGQAVDMLVLHYTGMTSLEAALSRLTDPEAKVSSHYLVSESGDVYRLVGDEARAWHAGVSFWRGVTNINARSIGVEIENPGHEFGYRPFPKVQMDTVVSLCRELLRNHVIPARNVVGHSDVAPTRKEDPGELFDWPLLARNGIGLWPHEGRPGASSQQFSDEEMLSAIGYDTQNMSAAVTAFQRRFLPAKVTGKIDEEVRARLVTVAKTLSP